MMLKKIKESKMGILVTLILMFGCVVSLIGAETQQVNSIDTLKQYEAALYLAPKLPHSIQGFEDCLSCHKDGAKGAPKTPHPERINCIKCHVPE